MKGSHIFQIKVVKVEAKQDKDGLKRLCKQYLADTLSSTKKLSPS